MIIRNQLDQNNCQNIGNLEAEKINRIVYTYNVEFNISLFTKFPNLEELQFENLNLSELNLTNNVPNITITLVRMLLVNCKNIKQRQHLFQQFCISQLIINDESSKEILEDICFIDQFQYLKHIQFVHCILHDLTNIFQCYHLEQISFSDCNFSELESANNDSQKKWLKTLYIKHCSKLDNLKNILKQLNLDKLELQNQNKNRDENLQQLINTQTHLQTLIIINFQFQEIELINVQNFVIINSEIATLKFDDNLHSLKIQDCNNLKRFELRNLRQIAITDLNVQYQNNSFLSQIEKIDLFKIQQSFQLLQIRLLLQTHEIQILKFNFANFKTNQTNQFGVESILLKKKVQTLNQSFHPENTTLNSKTVELNNCTGLQFFKEIFNVKVEKLKINDFSRRIDNLDVLNDFKNISTLHLSFCWSLQNLDSLMTLKDLKTLCFNSLNFSKIDFSQFSSKTFFVKKVKFSNCYFLQNSKQLFNYFHTEKLVFQNQKLLDLNYLRDLPLFKQLLIKNCTVLENIQLLMNGSAYELLHLEGVNFKHNVDIVVEKEFRQKVNKMVLKSCLNKEEIQRFLQSFDAEVVEMDFANNMNALVLHNSIQRVVVLGCEYVNYAKPMRNSAFIVDLVLYKPQLNFLNQLKKLKELQSLEILDCCELTHLQQLRFCNNLKSLTVNKTGLGDISAITNLQEIQSINLLNNERLPTEYQMDIQGNQKHILQIFKKYQKSREYRKYRQQVPILMQYLSAITDSIHQMKEKYDAQFKENKIRFIQSLTIIIRYQK